MSVDFGALEKGSSIHIRRSNGRVHKAIVTQLQPSSASVTVEWFEDDETKGKEVTLEMIFELNPELASSNLKPTQTPAPGRPASRRTEARQGGNRRTILPVPGSALRAQQKENRSPSPAYQPRRSVKNDAPASSRQSMSSNIPKPYDVDSKMSNANNNVNGNGSMMPPPKAPPRGRKSNVVDEVERLRRNREERRAAQVIERERRREFYDPNNANWEFAIMIKEFRATLDMKPLTAADPVLDHRICVCVRKRPLNKKEINRKEIDVTTIPSKNVVMVSEPKSKVDMTKYLENQTFRFDYSFDDTCTNEMVYWYTARPLVECIFDGGMATCFAYGQTGSGKTHTMGGDFTAGKSQDTRKGIYALAAQDVFHQLQKQTYRHLNLEVHASFFEIYSGKVFDLLNKKCRLRVLEDGRQQVQVVGLQERRVSTLDEVLQLIAEGTRCRTSGVTSANQHSSRSHAVFQLILRRSGPRQMLHGKFSLIDLAGNERGADTTSADRQTRVEGSEINKSLLALKECIRAMSQNKQHLPFRASKLTQVLRDSFIGERSRTCMIATISPGITSCEHTLNTLRYADRVKELAVEEGMEEPFKKKPAVGGGPLDRIEESPQQMNLNSPNNSDLALISSLCENEVSREMFEVHQTVSTLQEIEEETVESHRNFLHGVTAAMSQSANLFNMTEDVDFDPEDYVSKLKDQLRASNEEYQKLRNDLMEKLDTFQAALLEEEAVSRNMKNRKQNKH
ncbi:kinesin-like protein KIF2A isoform X3 [Clavelina lepadiformis]|uniref:Kinesin-like protein n=1 Tax=Clavelina lepadiformis TaxID=159417 RepID=A0ABP0FSC0_CLALP